MFKITARPIRRLLRDLFNSATFAIALLSATASPAFAQPYPNHPIRMVVPFPAGGATDLFARAVSRKLGEQLGVAIVIDNKPGAGGIIGSSAVANAAPDGYTLLLTTSSTHSVAPSINAKLPYDVVKDFTPIVHVGSAPVILLVPVTAPANDLKGWIAYARQHPGKLSYASSGIGTGSHLSSEYLKAQTGLDLIHVPYRGTGLAAPDVISGKVDMMFDSLPSGIAYVKAGRLKALGISTAKRSPLLPDLPAISETIPGFETVTWFGIYGPKAMPADLVDRVNAAANEALRDEGLKKELARLGIEPAGGTPRQFADMAQADRVKWKKIIVDRKLTIE